MKPIVTIQNSSQWLILDTNIITFLNDEARQEAVEQILIDAESDGFKPAFSEMTLFEALTNANPKDIIEIEKTTKKLDNFAINTLVLRMGALLHNCYKQEGILQRNSDIDMGDRIIAATAILQGAQIFTGNARDFPWPFFIDNQTIDAPFTSKNSNNQLFPLAIKQPNIPILQSYFDRHENEMQAIRKVNKKKAKVTT